MLAVDRAEHWLPGCLPGRVPSVNHHWHPPCDRPGSRSNYMNAIRRSGGCQPHAWVNDTCQKDGHSAPCTGRDRMSRMLPGWRVRAFGNDTLGSGRALRRRPAHVADSAIVARTPKPWSRPGCRCDLSVGTCARSSSVIAVLQRDHARRVRDGSEWTEPVGDCVDGDAGHQRRRGGNVAQVAEAAVGEPALRRRVLWRRLRR